MYTDTEGIVLRQTKTASGRRMVTVFSKQYGKIGCGTSINEGGRNKTALALRPFSYGRYEIYKNRDSWNIRAAELVRSWFSIGEDLDKFMTASYVLELTDRMLEDEQPVPALFSLLESFFTLLEKRRRSYETLQIGFMLKALESMGCAPQVKACVGCGAADAAFFSVADGGLLCEDCARKAQAAEPEPADGPAGEQQLLFAVDADIINILQFIRANPLARLDGLALKSGPAAALMRILKEYYAYHLGIANLKSEGLLG